MTSQAPTTDQVRFAFGANWSRFIECVDDRRIRAAEESLVEMMGGADAIRGRTFLDVGSGSGLFSLAAARLGAARVHSFDYDTNSVATTAQMKHRFGPPNAAWTVERGDILDRDYLTSLGKWDVVYSWGVLHHTGRMWEAIANASDLVADGGQLFIAIYNDQGRRTRLWLRIKRLYSANMLGRAAVLAAFVPFWTVRGAVGDLLRFRNPLRRYRDYRSERGMSILHDWIDWLGGYPFEAASPDAIFRYVAGRGFSLRNLAKSGDNSGCNQFVFERLTSSSTPPLTVLMAFHNDAPFIADAIDSILNQTYGDFEFVIVNDASTDGSRDIVARYTDPRIRLLDNPTNLRLARSLNRGLEAARAPLVARLDANDIACPDRIEKQMRFLRDHPEIALVGGQYEVIDTYDRPLPRAAMPKPVTEPGVRWYLLFDSPFVHSSVMFRKSVVDEAGRYDAAFDWAPSEDHDLWARMAVSDRMVNLRDVLVWQRFDPMSITYDTFKSYRADYLPRLTNFVATNMKRHLAVDDADDWAGLIAALFVDAIPVGVDTIQRYLDAVEEMERQFIAVHPEAADNRDVRRGKVQLLARALYRLTLCSRLASLPLFARMLRADPRTALRHLPKYAAVWLLGSRAWEVWRWWRARGQEQRK